MLESGSWGHSVLQTPALVKYVNFYQKPGSSNLIGWKLEVGMASFYSARQRLIDSKRNDPREQ